jgi:glycerate dehydrogenase
MQNEQRAHAFSAIVKSILFAYIAAMNIVVMDGFTLNPGDLDWAPLRALGDCVIYDRTAPDKIVSRARTAEIVLTNKVPLDCLTIERLIRLEYIGVLATGYNVVDIEAAWRRKIIVANVPGYSTQSVAQLVFALVLELAQRVGLHADMVQRGKWSQSPDFTFRASPLVELAGLTLGIVGYGQIGKAVACIGRAFGMKILVNTRTPVEQDGIGMGTLDQVFADSDIVTLHCPLTPETEGIVNRVRLESMKPSAFLINTGRGPLVNEADLAGALNRGLIAGAGLDVLSKEPPQPDNPLLTARNCMITPHLGWATLAARQRLIQIAAANIKCFLNGQPQNVVSRRDTPPPA